MSFQTFQKKSRNSKLREKYYINGKTHVDTEKNNLYFIIPWKLINGAGVEGGGGAGGLKPLGDREKNENLISVPSFIRYLRVWQVENYRNMLKLSCRPLAITSYKVVLKNKVNKVKK